MPSPSEPAAERISAKSDASAFSARVHDHVAAHVALVANLEQCGDLRDTPHRASIGEQVDGELAARLEHAAQAAQKGPAERARGLLLATEQVDRHVVEAFL